MIVASAVIVRPVIACPRSIARALFARPQPFLLDAADQEYLVVHRESEQHSETSGSAPMVRSAPVRETPRSESNQPFWKDRGDDAEGGAGRQQVHDGRGRRDQQAAEDDHQEEERQRDDNADEDRQLGRNHGRFVVGERRLAADVDRRRPSM